MSYTKSDKIIVSLIFLSLISGAILGIVFNHQEVFYFISLPIVIISFIVLGYINYTQPSHNSKSVNEE